METNDIQGNIIGGFQTRFETFVALAFRSGADRIRAAQWIGGLSAKVASVDQVRGTRKAMLDATRGLEPWLGVAISRRVIDAVHPSVALDDIEFNQGMERRKTAIGDETVPTDWVVGGSNRPVDLLVIIAANDPAPIEAMTGELVSQADTVGLDVTYREMGIRLPGEVEHFGFRDGISQPSIVGDRSDFGLQPGHFVFGYPRIEGGPPVTNQRDDIGLTRNGSLLVFRRLAQNVAAFRAFFASERDRLLPQWPGLTAEHLEALIVGRWPSGAPVSIELPDDPGASSNDNVFDFHDDLEAVRCPFGAHIRKINPRKGNRDVVDVPRILRRGIPFGPPFAVGNEGAERGLLFVAYQASIKRQFVFLSGTWMNSRDLPQAGGGFDLLVGRSSGPRTMPIQGPAGEVVVVFDESHWIRPTGGAYLFAPGRNGLAMLSQPSPTHRFFAAARDLELRAVARVAAEAEEDSPAERDGYLTSSRRGTIVRVERAHWPLTRLTSDGAAALPALRDLRHLDLAGEHFPTQILGAAGVRQLSTQLGLEHLSVHAAAVQGEILRTALAKLPLLSSLDVRGGDVTNDDVETILRGLPDLVALRLGATTADRGPHRFNSGRLTGAIIPQLDSLHSLRLLSVRGLRVDDASFAASDAMLTALEEFDAGETRIGDETVNRLAPPAHVRRLWLDRTRVTDRGISPFSQSAHLRDLDLSSTAVTSSVIGSLLAGTQLSRLAVAGLRLSDTSLSNLADARSLTELDLSGTDIADQSVAAIARLPLIEQLSIASTRVTPRGLANLASSSLMKLDMRWVPAEAETLGALFRMQRLRELELTWTQEDWGALASFDGHLSMTAPPPPRNGVLPVGLLQLSLEGPLEPDLCRNLSQLPHLEILSIRGGAEHFPEMVEGGFPNLRRVVAESAGLDDVGLDVLGQVPNLEALFISGNAVSASVIRLTAPHLHTLELRNTGVDDRAIEALARLPRLHCLDLPGTHVTADGTAALLPAARNLQSLALDGHQLTTVVATVLAESPTLVELYLYGRSVTDDVVARLAPVLRLRELNLFETSVTDRSVRTLIALSGLRTLRISSSSISRKLVTHLRSARPDILLDVEVNSVASDRSRRAFR